MAEALRPPSPFLRLNSQPLRLSQAEAILATGIADR